MTEAPRRKRWPRQRVRTFAWLTGAATFVAGVVGIAGSPKPSAAAALPRTEPALTAGTRPAARTPSTRTRSARKQEPASVT